MSVSVKYLGEEMHPLQISFFRLLVSLIVIWPFLMRMGGFREGISTSVPGLQVLRGIVGSTAMVLGFYAIVHLPLADAQAFSFSRNLFIVPLAFVLLSEAVGGDSSCLLQCGMTQQWRLVPRLRLSTAFLRNRSNRQSETLQHLKQAKSMTHEVSVSEY